VSGRVLSSLFLSFAASPIPLLPPADSSTLESGRPWLMGSVAASIKEVLPAKEIVESM
jgi:hypothetical protein